MREASLIGRIVITPVALCQNENVVVNTLRQQGCEVVLHPSMTPPTPEELGEYLRGAIGMVAGMEPVRAAGFRMRLLGYDPHANPLFVEELGGEYVSLDELLGQSDFLTLHLPLIPETRGPIGAPQLAQVRRTAFLTNCARGALVDEAAV